MGLQCNRCWCDIEELLCPECAADTGGSANTSTNSARDAITPLVVRAVTTDGCHHKQWYLEAIAEALQIKLPPHDLGIAP